jgi:hypothetical protein
MPINIRTAGLISPIRSLPVNRPVLTQQVTRRSPVDSFEAATAITQSPQVTSPTAPATPPATTSSSSGGGFFSNLLGSLKGLASGLLGKIGSWFSSNEGGWLSSAKNWLGGLLDGLFSKASTWFSGLLGAWQNKLGS